MDNNEEILGGSAGEKERRDRAYPQVERRGEVPPGASGGGGGGERKKQEWVKEGTGGDDQDDVATTVVVARGRETGDDGSAVVLPLYGDKEVPRYTGGYTVRRHGALSGGSGVCQRNGKDGCTAVAVDAVQLEFGSRLRRTPEARAAVAEAVATAVFDHLQSQSQRS